MIQWFLHQPWSTIILHVISTRPSRYIVSFVIILEPLHFGGGTSFVCCFCSVDHFTSLLWVYQLRGALTVTCGRYRWASQNRRNGGRYIIFVAVENICQTIRGAAMKVPGTTNLKCLADFLNSPSQATCIFLLFVPNAYSDAFDTAAVSRIFTLTSYPVSSCLSRIFSLGYNPVSIQSRSPIPSVMVMNHPCASRTDISLFNKMGRLTLHQSSININGWLPCHFRYRCVSEHILGY